MSSGASTVPSKNTLALRLATGLCGVTLFFGVLFCLVASPKMMAEKYTHQAVMAIEAGEYDVARTAMLSALRYEPLSVPSWKILSRVLEQSGRVQEAKTANAVIGHLTGAPMSSDPLYAMPADLRLSFLAIADRDSY